MIVGSSNCIDTNVSTNEAVRLPLIDNIFLTHLCQEKFYNKILFFMIFIINKQFIHNFRQNVLMFAHPNYFNYYTNNLRLNFIGFPSLHFLSIFY